MQNSQNKKVLQIFLLVVIAVVALGIGYASITAINLIINGNATASVNQNNFIVHFIEAKNITGTTGVGGTSVIESDDTKASFSVTGLSKVGDYAEAKYVVKNDSNGIGAEITLELTNSNSEYFKVTETIDDNKLQAGDTTLATVKVEMIKTPIVDDVSTNVTAKLTASPLENTQASGGTPSSVVKPEDPVSFATDSWATIQTAVRNNNTGVYNVGDTKEVNIDGVNYTVRIANKTTGEHCGDNDTAYSQTACGFVVEFADIITSMGMRNSSTNVGGYPETLVYDYLKNTLYGKLPADLQTVIKQTRVISGHGTSDTANFTTIDNLYLLSGIEVYGLDADGHNLYDTAAGTTHQLEYYSNNGVSYSTASWSGTNMEKAKKPNETSNSKWWFRSAISINNDGFGRISDYGTWYTHWADNSFGISPAFRIG